MPDQPSTNLLETARSQYPILRGMDIGYTETPKSDAGYLEYWPPGEIGGKSSPRPQSLPMEKPGLEIYRNDTRPIDILGDVVSHGLVNTDPQIKSYYEKFQSSLTPQQHSILADQYKRAAGNGEGRAFDEWAKASGIPAYFRGYAFQQWPMEDMDRYYTPNQLKMFDEMMGYLKMEGANQQNGANREMLQSVPKPAAPATAIDRLSHWLRGGR